MDPNIFQKFSENLKKILILAEKIAKDSGRQMDSEDMLIALATIRGTLAYDILANFDISPERLQIVVRLITNTGKKARNGGLTKDAREVIQSSVLIANKYRHLIIDAEHLLLALVYKKELNSHSVIERIGINPENIKKQIESIFNEISRVSDIKQGLALDNFSLDNEPISDNQAYENIQMDSIGKTAIKDNEKTLIEQFTSNLTTLAQKKKLDPLIVRENEIKRLIQILSRRTKNNPLLIGEPGVGKTAIIEGLAQRIVGGSVPNNLIGITILSLDITSLLAGTIYRGQFEARLKKLLAEIKSKGKNILFIDEIHTTVGTGSAEGSLDTANILKPLISRNEIRVIGATTFDEYKKHLEKDPAYERRFQAMKINQTSKSDTLKILVGLKQGYEKHHGIKFTPESLKSAVELSDRYISDRFLPDKAIDLIDEAAAATNVVTKNSLKLNKLQIQLSEIREQKEEAVNSENYESATHLRESELKLSEKISLLEKETEKDKKKIITDDDIAKVVSKWTGIQVENLTANEREKYANIEKRMSEKVIGQDQATEKIARAIRRNRVGISDPMRPIGSFLFLGPTGVGKTYLAKVLAKFLFGSDENLIKIDMSEFMEKHNVSRLIGAPAGYVGYEDGGKLTETVRHKPYSIILFDEIEKAHPEVFNILLQILEDGYLTDAKGRRVNFRNTIVILTSNLGTSELNRSAAIGFGATTENQIKKAEKRFDVIKNEVLETVKKRLRPELINRLDDLIVFKPLDKKSIRNIVTLNIAELKNRLKKQKISFAITAKAKDYLCNKGYSEEYGARPLRRAISENLEDQISDAILSENFSAGDKIIADIRNGKIEVKKD
jgi:ATP-dependent Clp protease ATP-binding subunit ClpC